MLEDAHRRQVLQPNNYRPNGINSTMCELWSAMVNRAITSTMKRPNMIGTPHHAAGMCMWVVRNQVSVRYIVSGSICQKTCIYAGVNMDHPVLVHCASSAFRPMGPAPHAPHHPNNRKQPHIHIHTQYIMYTKHWHIRRAYYIGTCMHITQI